MALLIVGAVGIVAARDDPVAAVSEQPSGTDAGADARPSEEPSDEAPEEFFSAFEEAFRSADVDFLLERLHPSVIDLYGSRSCRDELDIAPDETAAFVVETITGPAPFDWVTDGQTISLSDVLTVTVTRTVQGQTSSSEAHVAYVDHQLRWLTDCGEPLT